MNRGSADSITTSTYTTAPRQVIAVGIPSFGTVHLFWVARLFNLRFPMNKVVRQIHVIGKEVGDARNEIVAKALAIGEADPSLSCSHVFFLDDDVLAHPDALTQLFSRDRDIVSGLYFAKQSVPTPLVLMDDGVHTSWIPGDLVECAGHGMGLTLIKTDVFRAMRDRLNLGLDQFGYPAWFKTTKDEIIVRPDGVRSFTNYTEDMHFLNLARQIGYRPCVDTSPQTFAFHYAAREQRGYPLKQWFEYAEHGTITWETATGQAVTWGAEVAA